VIEQAAAEIRHGARRTALAILESDPQEEAAQALAKFGRTMQAMPDREARKSLSHTDSSD
jgi:hypothetical protein